MILPEGISLPKAYDIVSCPLCGFCYADTAATKDDYDNYYTSYNNYSGIGEGKSFEKLFSAIMEMISPYLQTCDNILDIGFGNGAFLLHLSSSVYKNLTGFDPSQNSVDFITRKSGGGGHQCV